MDQVSKERKVELNEEAVAQQQVVSGGMGAEPPKEVKEAVAQQQKLFEIKGETPMSGGTRIPLTDTSYPWRSREELMSLYSQMYDGIDYYIRELPNDGIRSFLLVIIHGKAPSAEIQHNFWAEVRDASVDIDDHPLILAVHRGKEIKQPDGQDFVGFWRSAA